jgi:hypothetical protein
MEFPAVESVLRRVSQKMSKNEIRVKGRVDLFEIETTPLSEHAGDFLKPQVPLLQVMDDPVIEYRIETAIPIRKMLGIGNEEDRPLENGAGGFLESKLNHSRIDVYGVHALGMKVLTHKSYAVTSSAADFKTATPSGHRPDSSEVPGFQILNEPSHGAVYPHSFRPVDFHSDLSTSFSSSA